MKIPNSFNILGRTITVEYDDKLFFNDDCVGLAIYKQNKIIIDSNLPDSTKQIVFYHELFHYLLLYAGLNDLFKDEEKVSLLSELLYQFDKTQTFIKE